MAYRVTGAEVAQLVNTTIEADMINETVIGTANTLVNEVLASSEYSTLLLKDIEKYLAAHLLALRNPDLRVESQDGTTYMGKAGDGLKATVWGQQVLVLDYKGLFAGGEGAKKIGNMVALA